MNTQYAGRLERILAAIVDGLIVLFVSWAFYLILSALMMNDPNVVSISYLFQMIFSVLYAVLYQYYAGQTIGKKLLKIKIVDHKGSKPGLLVFFLREVVGKFASAVIFGIGFFMILWNKKRQGLHDIIAGTFVVKS